MSRELSQSPGDKVASWPASARLLLALSRSPAAADYAGGTERNVGDHALDFILKTVPNFTEMIRGKRVLDYGCGKGDQVIAMKRAGAAKVVGYDPYPKFQQASPGVEFTSELPCEPFDIVLSCSAFEHFAEPERELKTMCRLTVGRLVITWAEPWYSHSGSHMNFFTRVPWVNLLFPEHTVFLVRSLYRDDGAQSYETCKLGGAVNRMTVARFERIVRSSGMRIELMRHYATRGLPLVTRIPILRELLTSSCACILAPAALPTPDRT
jgi:SAM-dependent methyltransferase